MVNFWGFGVKGKSSGNQTRKEIENYTVGFSPEISGYGFDGTRRRNFKILYSLFLVYWFPRLIKNSFLFYIYLILKKIKQACLLRTVQHCTRHHTGVHR